jgi:AcrR family transcriptional regulator
MRTDAIARHGRARTLQEERSQRTRSRLAEAAIECLVESGYRGTTFVEVCRRAGFTRGAAHHHYRDLPALMLDAMRALNGRLADRASPLLGEVDDMEKRIDVGIDLLWDLFTAREFKAVVEIFVAQSHDSALSQRIRSELSVFREEVEEGFARSFPELVEDGEEALMMMRFAFLVLLGLGLLNATIDSGERAAQPDGMRALLKKVVKREVGLLRQH